MYKLFDGQIKYWHKPSSPFLRAATMGWTPICVCTLIPQPMIWTASTFKSARVSFGASTFQFCSSLFRFVCVFCFLPSLRVRSGDLGSSLGYVLFYWIVSLFLCHFILLFPIGVSIMVVQLRVNWTRFERLCTQPNGGESMRMCMTNLNYVV